MGSQVDGGKMNFFKKSGTSGTAGTNAMDAGLLLFLVLPRPGTSGTEFP